MTGQQLRNSILQEAIQGRLVSNVLQPGEKTGAELLQDILAERQKKENEEKGKKAKRLTLSPIEEELWDLPDGWCWTKIGDIFDHSAGKSLNSSKQSRGKVYPYLTTSNVYWEGINFDKVKEMAFTEEEYEKCSAIQNDILVCEGGDVGRSCIWTFEYSIGLQNHVHRLRAIKNTDVEFFNYVLRFYKSAGIITAKGIGIGGFSANALKGLSVPLPPLSIQKAIVEKIEELFPLVDEYDKAAFELNTLNEFLPDKLRKSVLQEAIHGNLVSNDIPKGEETAPELLQQILKERQDRENKAKGKKAKKLSLAVVDDDLDELPGGWCWCKLSDIGDCLYGVSESAKTVGQYKLLRITDIQNDNVNWETVPLSDYKKRDVENYLLKTGDLVFARTGGTVGKSYLINVVPDNAIYASYLIRVRFQGKVLLPKYIKYFFQSPQYWSQIIDSAEGTGQPNCNGTKLANLNIPLPPLSIQHRIVEKIEEVFAAIEKLQA